MSEQFVNPAFLKKYRLLVNSTDLEGLHTKTLDKCCVFCGKSAKSGLVTFDNKPHILPNLLGKNNCIGNQECDACNSRFGKWENDLTNFVAPYRSITGQKNKNGKIPETRSRKEDGNLPTLVKFVGSKPYLDFGNNTSDLRYDYANKTGTFVFRKQKYTPINVYKSFVKIALGMCPNDEVSRYRKAFDWLKGDYKPFNGIADIPMTLFRTRLNNKTWGESAFAQLYIRQKERAGAYLPRLALVVYSGMTVYQIFLPFCSETEEVDKQRKELQFEVFPAFLFGLDFKGKPSVTVNVDELPVVAYDMCHYDKVEEDEHLHFSYDHIDREIEGSEQFRVI